MVERAIPRLPFGGPIDAVLRFRKDRIGCLLDAARLYPDISRLRLGAFEIVLLSSPAIVQEMLVDKHALFIKSYGLSVFTKPLLGEGLLRLEQPQHRQRRRLLAPKFMPRRIAGYGAVMAERAEHSAKRLGTCPQVDMAEESMRLTLEIVGKTLFDAEVVGADADAVGEALHRAMTCVLSSLTSLVPLPPSVPTPTNLRLHRAVRQLDRIVYRMIAQRRASDQPGDDLLSVLLAARDEDGTGLTDQEVRDEAMTLFLAGHETTANALAWALYGLASHPDVYARLETELDTVLSGREVCMADLPSLPYLAQVVKESLRLFPPAYMIGRRATQDCEIGGYRVRKGQVVLVNIIGLQRRPDLYPDPERFDPDRFDPQRERDLPRGVFIPFGGGPRVCIGNHFALMEAQLILATWLRALRFELLEPSAPAYEPLITLRLAGGLQMRVHPRAVGG